MAEPEIKINGALPLATTVVFPGEPVEIKAKASSEEFFRTVALHGLYRTQLEPRLPESSFPSRTESNAAQEDIPHLIGHLLQKSSVCGPEGRRHLGSGREYLQTCFRNHENGTLHSAVVCDPPLALNSGAHRVILRGNFNGEPFTAVIEEKEGWRCQFLGEIVYLGMDNSEEVAQNPEAFLQFLVRSATGTDFFLDSGMRISASAGITIFHFPPGEVEAELRGGLCHLSEAAKGCFLHRFSGVF